MHKDCKFDEQPKQDRSDEESNAKQCNKCA